LTDQQRPETRRLHAMDRNTPPHLRPPRPKTECHSPPHLRLIRSSTAPPQQHAQHAALQRPQLQQVSRPSQGSPQRVNSRSIGHVSPRLSNQSQVVISAHQTDRVPAPRGPATASRQTQYSSGSTHVSQEISQAPSIRQVMSGPGATDQRNAVTSPKGWKTWPEVKIYAKNLLPNMTAEDIFKLFHGYGIITYIRINDRHSDAATIIFR
jgi:hypothetical protein